MKNFDFANVTITSERDGNKRLCLAGLLIHLWPGDWQKQLGRLNKKIDTENEELTLGFCRQSVRPIRHVSPNEWWVFYGLILVARIYGRQGNLWDCKAPEGKEPKVDMNDHMLEYRFQQIRKHLPVVFEDPTRVGVNP